VRTSKLDPCRSFIEAQLEKNPSYNGELLYERLVQLGYRGKKTIMKAYAARLRKKLTQQAVMRFETEPGRQAQVDWKEFRKQIVDVTRQKLDELRQYTGKAHTKAACSLRAHPAYGRHIRQAANGMLSIDREKIDAEALLDGKFLVSSSSMKLDAADVVAGYKQLWEIERVFRDLKNTLDVRLVYHRLEERIRSHILICWLAMVLIRYTENMADRSWYQIEKALSTVTAGLIESEKVNLWYCSDISEEAKEIFAALAIELPRKVLAMATKQDAV
jgi:transposase